MVLLTLFNELNEINDNHYVAKTLNDEHTYYEDENTGELFVNRIRVYNILVKNGETPTLLTNNYSFYLKNIKNYRCVFIPYFVFADPIKINKSMTGIVNNNNLASITNEYQLIYHSLFNKEYLDNHIRDILETFPEMTFVVGKENDFLESRSGQCLDGVHDEINNFATKKFLSEKYLNVTKYNFLLDIPVDDSAESFSAISYYPFEYAIHYTDTNFIIRSDIHQQNTAQYRILMDNGYLKFEKHENGFYFYTVIGIPKKRLLLYDTALKMKKSFLKF